MSIFGTRKPMIFIGTVSPFEVFIFEGGFAMQIYTEKNSLIIAPEGDIDHHSAEKIRREADKCLESSGIINIVFDLSKTAFMDSSGIGMIIGRYRKVSILGGKITIRNADDALMRIIGISGLGNIVTIEKRCYNEQNEA